ncbi:MAG: hypothetical protein ACFFCH_00850 [Promethearchaeota archaeon]
MSTQILVSDTFYHRKNPISKISDEEIKAEVKFAYAELATASKGCCTDKSWDSKSSWSPRQNRAKLFGYPADKLPESLTDAYAGCGKIRGRVCR